MSLVTDLVEHYQQLIERGDLKPEDVPTWRLMAEEWDVSRATAQEIRRLLTAANLATPQIVHGLPLGPITDMDYAFRFMPKVQPRNEDGCLLWDAGTRKGYGRFWLNGRYVHAHRVAWEYRHGPVTDGLELDHVFARGCRSRLCVNVAHLELVTGSENTRRAFEAARYMASIQVRTELDSD